MEAPAWVTPGISTLGTRGASGSARGEGTETVSRPPSSGAGRRRAVRVGGGVADMVIRSAAGGRLPGPQASTPHHYIITERLLLFTDRIDIFTDVQRIEEKPATRTRSPRMPTAGMGRTYDAASFSITVR